MSEPFLKLRWLIFVVLGTWGMAVSALADGSTAPEYFSTSLMSQAERFAANDNYLEDEPLLAENKNYSSTKNLRGKPVSLNRPLKLNMNYGKGLFSDTGYALTAPLRWDKSDWITASWVAAGTGVFFMLDDEIKSKFQDNRSSTTDDISELFEHFGNGAITLPAVAGFYLYGRFGENEKIERTALLAAESFLVSGLFSTIIKVGVGRHRPNKDNNSSQYDGFSTSNKSFPSGHTTTAFAIATVVANEYEDVPLAAPLAYGVATLAGLSRINDNQHWASDVFFGAVLGYFTSKTILKLHSNKKGRHFTIYPRANYQGGGLVLSSQF